MKSQTYPETIPTDYAGDEILASAYRAGWNHGHGIACHNVPSLGARIFSETLGRVVVGAGNIREVHESECFEAAANSRQFSPFEFLAQEINDLGEGDDETPSSDEAWSAFEQGEYDSISADLATYDAEDYGITEDDEEE